MMISMHLCTMPIDFLDLVRQAIIVCIRKDLIRKLEAGKAKWVSEG